MNIRREHIPYRAAKSLYRSGRWAYRAVRSLGNRLLNLVDTPLVILIYHRVAAISPDPEMIAVSPDNFRRQMEFLKRSFPVARFDDDWLSLNQEAVVITFDDGYADNVVNALPILDELEMPATFFISTGHIGTGHVFWWHRLESILLGEGMFPDRFVLKDRRFGGSWPTSTSGQRRDLYAVLSLRMRNADSVCREDWLRQLEEWTPPGTGRDLSLHRSMSGQEIRMLAASPWATVGAHTVSHCALSALSEKQQRHEIFSSKETLETITGMEVCTFSYPFGRKSEYNRTSVHLCREAGFVRAASNFPGQVHRWTDPLQLPRHLVRDWDVDTFASELKGFWTR